MHLLIAAAGSGKRMSDKGNKLLLPVAGKPVLAWTLEAAFNADSIQWIGIIGQQIDQESIMGLINQNDKPVQWIIGGSSRQESVQKGLNSLPKEAKYVLIHDGARCLASAELLNKFALEVNAGQALIAATPVVDTIKKIDSQGYIIETPNRENLWAAQTPQGFLVDELKKAHLEALKKNWEVTDDASLFERLGKPVKIFETSPSNIKLTTPFDLVIAEAVLGARNSS